MYLFCIRTPHWFIRQGWGQRENIQVNRSFHGEQCRLSQCIDVNAFFISLTEHYVKPEDMNAMDRILRVNQCMCGTDTDIYLQGITLWAWNMWLSYSASVQRFSFKRGWHPEFRIPQCHHMFRRFLPLDQICWWFCVCTVHHLSNIRWVRSLYGTAW